jgi:hypothetical protein
METSLQAACRLIAAMPEAERLALIDFIAWRGALVGETQTIDAEWQSFSTVYEQVFIETMRRIDRDPRVD